MKAQSIFTGSTSYGVPVEAAQGIDGRWFVREYKWNGYGMGWTKWNPVSDLKHPTRIKQGSEYPGAPEYIDLSEEESKNYIDFGFKVLRKATGPLRVRLPD